MSYRVALLVLTSIATLGLPLREPASARLDQRSATFAQATRPAESLAPSSVGAEEESGTSDAPPASTPLPSQETEALQQQLSRLGYYQGAIDGVYGPETGNAVSVFQRDAGLATTGLPDPLTLQRLQATENPLGIVPEAPQPDPDNPLASEADDGVLPDVPEDDFASTPLDEGAAEAEPLTTETTENPAETEVEPETGGGGLMRLALVGLAIAAMGTAGAVAFLFLFRRRSTHVSSAPDLAPSEAPAAERPIVTSEAATGVSVASEATGVSNTFVPELEPTPALPVTPPLPIADTPHNGHNPEATAPPPPVAPSSALAPETTTKLVPVNIVDELVQDLQNPDPAQRRKAIWELGQRGNSAAVQPLSRLMLDADSKERSLILAALAEISTQTLKPMNRALALSLQDENPEVRKNAIRDLTRIYDLMGQAGTMLSHAASDSDPEVRQTASWAMDQLNRMRLKAVNPDETPSLQGHNGSSSE